MNESSCLKKSRFRLQEKLDFQTSDLGPWTWGDLGGILNFDPGLEVGVDLNTSFLRPARDATEETGGTARKQGLGPQSEV